MATTDTAADTRAVGRGQTNTRTLFSLLAALALIVIGYLLATWINGGVHMNTGRTTPKVISSLNVFALMFVLALAIERMVQPFSSWLGPDTHEVKKELAAAGANKDEKTEELNKGRDLTAVVCWGMASAFGFVLASATNVTLLRAIVSDGTAPAWGWDLLLTGFAVGAGTKPLNDLWTRLQNK